MPSLPLLWPSDDVSSKDFSILEHTENNNSGRRQLRNFSVNSLTLFQTTNFRLFKTERGCRRQIRDENGGKFSTLVENTVRKEKLFVTNNFSFSHSVFKGFLLQTRKNQGLVWERVKTVMFALQLSFKLSFLF